MCRNEYCNNSVRKGNYADHYDVLIYISAVYLICTYVKPDIIADRLCGMYLRKTYCMFLYLFTNVCVGEENIFNYWLSTYCAYMRI